MTYDFARFYLINDFGHSGSSVSTVIQKVELI